MRAYEVIVKKREGGELSSSEIDFLVQGYTRGEIPDYQMSSFLMAAFLQGLNSQETAQLTKSMVHSGEVLDLSRISGIKVDKHSTGGVGDKTTLALAPLVASADLNVAKMSGRGLGHSGGTIDKLEAFLGFTPELSMENFIEQVQKHNLAIVGQTKQLAPADGKIYSLRDVTATVDSIPLIASSIMSKKLAAGTNMIVLDVKVGKGAFMENLEDATALGHEMVNIGKNLGRKTVAVISDMNQPLGRKVGNSLEVQEAIATLKGNGPEDFKELCLNLGAILLNMAEKVTTVTEGKKLLSNKINSGEALAKLEQLVKAQNGDTSGIHNTENLPQAKHYKILTADKSGFITNLDAKKVGLASVNLGAGRATKEDKIDLSVGIELNKKLGDEVSTGDELAKIWYNDEDKLLQAAPILEDAFDISESASGKSLIYGMITENTNPGELDSI
ncbi:pyrimidine-nucleoside phosphorylase [Natranaerobius thermophilus]|uniref:Pyrimidine-nucleoside phosphorylase n=1 Tax=Natranaerobius thermophilus (strain ATCC BAA-1301 / DSM 18059 / JW/NM-WN-LF) TaxID=457570 RepID=B2A4Z7_NATTJ|nr:pyrimidine-nucleoside phosphorylase [Natranaerobius thermophilus]ACB85239.1 thymidine phosphorylase [Natranaerobius thermophilus JW/NM-WN-LF]